MPPEARLALLGVNSENSPVDCFRKRGILAENAPKLGIRQAILAAPRRHNNFMFMDYLLVQKLCFLIQFRFTVKKFLKICKARLTNNVKRAILIL